MSEWGIPDWRDISAYGDVSIWSLGRWRWEFLRRRDDVRRFYDKQSELQYQCDLTTWESHLTNTNLSNSDLQYIRSKPPKKPDAPQFIVRCGQDEFTEFGDYFIGNPRIGDGPNARRDVEAMADYKWTVEGSRPDTMLPTAALERGEVVIAFSLDKPIAAQLEAAKSLLQGHQKYLHGKHLQKKRHPTKWLTYLRALDAREAKELQQHNAPRGWPEIAEILPLVNSVEGARKAYAAGLDLCVNF